MSTSDQDSTSPLTRKQLREIRLTGSTPVITAEQAAQAAAAPPAPVTTPVVPVVPPVPTDSPAEEASEGSQAGAPLTRREAREKERLRTASVSVVPDSDHADQEETEALQTADAEPAVETYEPHSADVAPVYEPYAVAEDATEAGDAYIVDEQAEVVATPEPVFVSEVPAFSHHEPEYAVDGADDAPVVGTAAAEAEDYAHSADYVVDEVAETPVGAAAAYDAEPADNVAADERPIVNPAFGEALLAEHTEQPAFAPSFDELITSGDSAGSQHAAPSALIFTHSPREGSLDGPVAATGEVIITGSYELPHGIGSQGHAHGTTDGKDVDAVLIDGELPPASSPTPIAASAAVSTLKPAGEVIRPPAPEKGNKLMLTLAITAGGLAIVLATALIIAFTTNVI